MPRYYVHLTYIFEVAAGDVESAYETAVQRMPARTRGCLPEPDEHLITETDDIEPE